MKIYIRLLSIILSILLTNCKNESKQGEASNISAQDFSTKIKNLPNAPILDVRTPDEFAKGHLANAKNIDWNGNDFEKQIAMFDKSKPIFIYCLSGGRSSSAASKMRSDGFIEVYELDGGIMQWRNENLPETNDSQSPKTESLTKTQYEEKLNSEKLVLVDFYADWCGPCQKMKPFLDEISKENADKVTILRINADDNQELCKTLGVSSLPTLLLYKNKKSIWSNKGFIDKQRLVSVILNK